MSFFNVVCALAFGLSFGLASTVGDSIEGVLLGAFSIFFIVYVSKLRSKCRGIWFLMGLSFHLVAFYWLPYTLGLFGGFSVFLSYCLFFLFAAVSSIQFIVVGYLNNIFAQGSLARYRVNLASAWFIVEFLFPRMFPWSLAHPFISWTSFSGMAEIMGVYILSAILIFLGEWVYFLFSKPPGILIDNLLFIIGTPIIFALCLIISSWRNGYILSEINDSPKIKAGIIQGNLAAKDKRDPSLLSVNMLQYHSLSRAAENAGAELLIWPETIMTNWTPNNLQTLRGSEFDPDSELKVPLLYGTLSYERRSGVSFSESELRRMSRREHWELGFRRYNSGFLIDKNSKIKGVYHKQVLMPFGEFMPFSEYAPWLRNLSPQTGNFSKGRIKDPLQVSVGNRLIKMGVLICYEDLVAGPAIEEVQRGANLLVNLTNDVWYGDSSAPYQHNLLASWRAIENRRFLLRATNTGLTAVVNPLGITTDSLALFTADKLTTGVSLLNISTIYSLIGDVPNYLMCIFLLVMQFLKTRDRVC